MLHFRAMRFIAGADNFNKQLKANIHAYFMNMPNRHVHAFPRAMHKWRKFIELDREANPLKSNDMAALHKKLFAEHSTYLFH